MDLLENPFHILKVSAQTNRRQIVEQAENMSLTLDPEQCNKARADLTSPRRRLSAEIAWFPGATSENAEATIALIQETPDAAKGANNLSPLSRSNLIAQAIQELVNPMPDEMARWILLLSNYVEKIDSNEVLIAINADRQVAGFPQISDLNLIDEELYEQRRYYCGSIKIALDTMQPLNLVAAITKAIEAATQVGKNPAPMLLDDLVDLYELEAQQFLTKEGENIENLIKTIRNKVSARALDSLVERDIFRLIAMVKNWDVVAQPIQVSARARGKQHKASRDLAFDLRQLSLFLFNEHDKLKFSQMITEMLGTVFAEVDAVVEKVDQDRQALNDIEKNRSMTAKRSNPHILTTNRNPVSKEDSSDMKFRRIMKRIGWIIAIIFVVFCVYQCSKSKSNKSSTEEKYVKPAPGTADQVKEVKEIRWCLREKGEIEALRSQNDHSSKAVRSFNSRVDEWNDLCGHIKYRYSNRYNPLTEAENDTGVKYEGQIQH